MRAAALVLLLLQCLQAGAQDSRPGTRPATRPVPFDSDDSVRLLAGAVMPVRVAEFVRDLCALGLDAGSESRPRTLKWVQDQLVAAELTAGQVIGARRGGIEAFMPCAGHRQKLSGRAVVLSADLWSDPGAGRHRHATGAGALIESVRVMRATQKGGHFGELGFDVLVRLDSAVEGPASRSESWPAAESVLGEICFGDLPVASRDHLRIAVTAHAGQAALIEDLRLLFARFKGQQGFWKEITVVADGAARRADGAPCFTLSSPSDGGGGPESRAGAIVRPASRPAAPEQRAAVRAARAALVILAHLAERHRAR